MLSARYYAAIPIEGFTTVLLVLGIAYPIFSVKVHMLIF
jgi:hypothetical protein